MRSSASGAEFVIFISTPPQSPPSAGHPVIYLLDANASFATMTEALAMQSSRPAATGVQPAVVVGIGYPTDKPLNPVRRTFDYTPTVREEALAPRPDGTPWPATGGADAFLDFVENELKPSIVGLPIDKARQGIFGHSFGGLCVLHALFTRPGTFHAYVAGSPSIWFGERVVLSVESAFRQRFRSEPQSLRLLIGIGSDEQTVRATDTPKRAAWITSNRMVDNARDMAARLTELAPYGLDLSYQEFAGENHVSVLPALISRALRLTLSPTAQ